MPPLHVEAFCFFLLSSFKINYKLTVRPLVKFIMSSYTNYGRASFQSVSKNWR